MNDVIAETRGMAQCVLALTLEHSPNEQITNRFGTVIDPMLHYTCEILCVLSEAQIVANNDSPFEGDLHIHSRLDGIRLSSAISFVEKLYPQMEYVSKAVVATFILPIQVPAESLSSMCTLLIDEYRNLKSQTNASKLAIFRRLRFIAQSTSFLLDDTSGLLKCLLLWRNDCAQSFILRALWYEIMKVLVPVDSVHQSVDFISCIANKSLLPAFITQHED
jgi:hypothetical protein